MKLFAIYVGGEHPSANIEVHDIRFVVARSLDETHDHLVREWWGRPGSLHIDCWSEISQADGHRVHLRAEPSTSEQRLYYVNLGGYDRVEFSERHKNVFVVARSLAEAKSRALTKAKGWTDLHRDDLYEAEQAFALDQVTGLERLHIHLEPADGLEDSPFTCKYTPLPAR